MKPGTLDLLRSIRRWTWSQKYRFQLGQQWLIFASFGLLLITVAKSLGLRAGSVLVIAIPLGFLCMWLWGWFLDVVVKQGQQDEQEIIRRSKIWPIQVEHMEETKRLLEEIRSILRSLQGDK